jgi:hypothetical protein
MALPKPRRRQPERVKPTVFCSDCRHSYDWHSKAIDGHLILCRCRLDAKSEYGKWSKFLSDAACDNFQQRQEDEQNG